MLTIWGRANSTNVQKVIWACDELDLNFERRDLGGTFGGNRDPSYLAKNPNGLVPTIEDDDFVLWESHAILRYLAAGDAQNRLLPASLDRRQRANIDRWIDWQLVSLGLTLRTLFVLLSGPARGQAGQSEIEGATRNAATMFGILNDHLMNHEFVGGGRFTLADIPVGISVHRWLNLPIERPAMPGLERWYARLCERPGFQRVRSIPLR